VLALRVIVIVAADGEDSQGKNGHGLTGASCMLNFEDHASLWPEIRRSSARLKNFV
jgi:hypothetical protein